MLKDLHIQNDNSKEETYKTDFDENRDMNTEQDVLNFAFCTIFSMASRQKNPIIHFML
jgi:hypothetical protein